MGKHSAEEILAAIGPDMSIFGDAQQLASWCRVAPGSHESAGKRNNAKTRNANR